MNTRVALAAFTLAVSGLVASGPARSQTSRDLLIAKGAKALTAVELKRILPGSDIAGAALRGGSIQWTLRTDGSIAGSFYDLTGNGTEVAGTWRIGDKGQFCFRIQGSGGVYTQSSCEDWFKLGSNFYAVRDGEAVRRTIKKG